jgi:hypothetical protein
MRAATLILGAVAVASILIALAFILSAGDSSKAVTTTVTEKIIEVPEPGPQEEADETLGQGTELGGPTRCGKELSIENTSCEVGEAVHAKYEEGTRGLLIVEDPESGEYLEFNCGEPTPVICKQSGGPGTVSFGA